MTRAALRGLGACLLAAVSAAAAWGADPPAATRAEPPRGVLIATEHSAFKQALSARIEADVRARGWVPKVVELRALGTVCVDDYGAIVLVNEIWAWRLRRHVRKFLKPLSDADRAKVVLVSTTKDPDWRTREAGVHAVTAASRMDGVAGVAAFVAARLDAIMQGD